MNKAKVRAVATTALTLACVQALACTLTIGALSTEAAAAGPEDGAPCLPRRSVSVQVDPFEGDGDLAARVVEQTLSELYARRSATCSPATSAGTPEGPSPGGSRPSDPVVVVAVRWTGIDKARIVVAVQTIRREVQAMRDVDLHDVPRDGVPLAIGIAADELLSAVAERPALVELPSPAPPVPPRPAPPPPISPAKTRETAPHRLHGVGFAAAVEGYGSGVWLAGPDAHLALDLAPRLGLVVKVGSRLPADRRPAAEIRLASAHVAGLGLRFGPNAGLNPRGIAATLGADSIWLLGTLHGTDDRVGTTVSAWAGAEVWAPLPADLRILAQARVGGPLTPLRMTSDRVPSDSSTILAGIGFSATVGVLAPF